MKTSNMFPRPMIAYQQSKMKHLLERFYPQTGNKTVTKTDYHGLEDYVGHLLLIQSVLMSSKNEHNLTLDYTTGVPKGQWHFF